MSSPFEMLRASGSSPEGGSPAGGMASDETIERVGDLISSSRVFALVKGTPDQPRCGFSATVLALLNQVGVEYGTFDVLTDPEIRAAAKVHAAWPTFPQVYVDGEFVGGNDIIAQLAASGELRQVLEGSEP